MNDGMLWDSWRRVAGDGDESRAAWSELIARWSEPQRHYHTLEHLLYVLTFMDEWFALPPDETVLAAWLHDAVYDPTSSSNESDSADLAGELLPRIGRGHLAGAVRRIILTTVDHSEATDRASEIMLDADLAILGADPVTYLRYVEAVRQEYSHVPDEDFRTGRSTILRSFLGRDRIYRDPRVHEALDAAARRNLSAELAVYDTRDLSS